MATVRPALLLAPRTYLDDVRDRLADAGGQSAVARRETGALYDWIIRLLDRQGISNLAAVAFTERHGGARWRDVDGEFASRPLCPKLLSYWHFAECGYRKDVGSCARRDLLPFCALPRIPARKGALSQAAFSLYLFIRDLCDGDLVGWVDARLSTADPGQGMPDRAALMRAAVLDPLVNIVGTGSKTWSMILAELLLGADPGRERWVTTGASFVAIDSLVHAYLHRTGILRRLEAKHAYGPACYAPRGCAEIIAGLATHIDAREFHPEFPACFPRWLQWSIWMFCAEGGRNICNATIIDDRYPCEQVFCPAVHVCEKIAIKPYC